MMRARFRRTLVKIGAVVVFVLLVGMTYQGVSTAFERREYPRPGRLVDVGDHQLHLYCTGEGTPIVVLEAPAAGMSASWGWVQPEVSPVTRVCSYDRTGHGWSEDADAPEDPLDAPRELRAMLQHAGEPGPYIVAGYEIGAAFATLLASELRSDVRALVLVDAPAAQDRGGPALTTASPWLARAGVLRVTRAAARETAGLPDPARGALRAFLNRPDHLTRALAEIARRRDIVDRAARVQLSSDLPVTRIRSASGGRTPFFVDRTTAMHVSEELIKAVRAARRAPHAR